MAMKAMNIPQKTYKEKKKLNYLMQEIAWLKSKHSGKLVKAPIVHVYVL